MVRLRLGRFAYELYYTRTRAVLPREEVRRRIALVAGHLGYITGLFEYVMTDMVLLRFFALSGCVLIVGYQASQPKIQWLSAGWNSVFSLVNIYHIVLLLRPLPPFSEEEASLLAALGERLTKRQFHSLRKAGEWRSFEAGECLVKEGTPGEEVFLLSAGSCDVLQGGLPVGCLVGGAVVGELGLLTSAPGGPEAEASATVVAREDVRCLCLPRARLQQEPELGQAIQGVLAAALAAKVASLPGQWRTQRCAALLELAAAAGPGDAAAAVLAEADRLCERSSLSAEERQRMREAVERASGRRLPGPGPAVQEARPGGAAGREAAGGEE